MPEKGFWERGGFGFGFFFFISNSFVLRLMVNLIICFIYCVQHQQSQNSFLFYHSLMGLNKTSVSQKGNREKNTLFYAHWKTCQGPKMLHWHKPVSLHLTWLDTKLSYVLQSQNIKIWTGSVLTHLQYIWKEIQAVGSSSVLKSSLIALKYYRVFKAEICKGVP